MKKIIIIFQIFVLICTQNAFAADGASSEQPLVPHSAISPMPDEYKLPRMLLPDSVVSFNKYKTKQGKRVKINYFTGRFGATWGNEFRQKIYEIENQFQEKIEILLTLSSTMEDAKILKQRMALVGRKLIIVEIPDQIQKQFLEDAERRAQGGLKELWWDTNQKIDKFRHPKKTMSNFSKVLKNQFVKPTKEDVRLTIITTSITAATTFALSIGIDWRFAVAMTAARTFVTGTTSLYRTTINNLYRTNLFNDLKVPSTTRQTATKLLTLGTLIGQGYYAIGTNFFGDHYSLTQTQLLSHMLTSGIVESASSTQRNNRLSQQANRNMALNTFLVGSVIGALGTIGHVGPMVYEAGFISVSALQSVSIAIFSGLYLAYKYQAAKIEKLAQKDLSLYLEERARKLLSFRRIKRERLRQAREHAIMRRQALAEMVYQARVSRAAQYQQINPPSCRLLFQ